MEQSAQSSTDPRRREPRVERHDSIEIFPCRMGAEGRFVHAQLVDSSEHGIGLLCGQLMVKGDEFLMKVNAPELTLAIYTVRFVLATGNQFRIGAEHTGMVNNPQGLDPAKLRAWLATKVASEKEAQW